MKNVNKILMGVVVLLASISLLSGQGYCIGEIPNTDLFVPSNTYPSPKPGNIGGLKPLNLETKIVESGLPKAIIVVDMDNADYLEMANDINISIAGLIPGVTLTIINDDTFLANPEVYMQTPPPNPTQIPIILIGNYASNKVIDEYVYRQGRLYCDADRPGVGNYTINNVRISNKAGTLFTNAIVISGQYLRTTVNSVYRNEVENAVDHFVGNTMLGGAAHQGNNIIFNETVANKSSNYWSTQGPNTYNPGDSTSLGSVAMMGNNYWITGKTGYAAAFIQVINNIAWLCSSANNSFNNDPNNLHHPGWYPPQGDPNEHHWLGGPAELGDNGNALDFNISPAITAWRNIERSPYFSDPNLAHNAYFNNIEERLLITEVLCYLTQMHYKNAVQVGASYKAILSIPHPPENLIEPVGNHELGSALSMLKAGQYFSWDGYNYNAQTVIQGGYTAFPTPTNWFALQSFPNNANEWKGLGNCYYRPYLGLTFGADDAGEYFNAEHEDTQQYCWMSDSAQVPEITGYFENNGLGIFQNGVNRSMADLYLMLTPNIGTKPAFGDSGGLMSPDFQPHSLTFWAEKYSDGRYAWLFNRFRNNTWGEGHYGWNGHPGGDEIGKSFLTFGLKNITPVEPVDLLGVKIAFLEDDMRAFLDSYQNTRLTLAEEVYSDAPGEVHVLAGAEPFFKITLRSGLDTNNQFMCIDGIGVVGHGHNDHLAITEFEDNSRLWLADHRWDEKAKEWHNALTVTRGNELADARSSNTASVRDAASFDKTGLLTMELPEYGAYNGYHVSGWSTDTSRSMIWLKEGFFFILDEVKANGASSGTYELKLNWETLGNYVINGDTIDVEQSGPEHFIIKTLGGNYALWQTFPHQQGGDCWDIYPYANGAHPSLINTTFSQSLNVDEKKSIPSLLYTYSGTDNPYQYAISPINNDTIYHITSPVTDADIYIGKSLNTQLKTIQPGFTVEANLFYKEPNYFALVNAFSLNQNGALFESDVPASVEFDVPTLSGIIEVKQTAQVSLYAPEDGYTVQIKELPDGVWQTIPASWANNLFTFTIAEPGKYAVAFVGPEPVLNNIANQEIEVGQALEFTISAEDPDSQVLAFRGYGYPFKHGADLANNGDKTATFNWIPQAEDIGRHGALFVVSDGEHTDSQLAAITVLEEGGIVESGNVALNKNYKVAVNNAALTPAGNTMLTDGDINNYSQYSSGTDPWHLTVVVDLGQEIPLSLVRLYTHGTLAGEDGGVIHPSSIDVFTSNSETSFPTTPDISIPVVPPAQHPTWFTIESAGNFEEGAVSGRYVKFYLTFIRPVGFSGYSTYGRVKEIEINNYVNPSPQINPIEPITITGGQNIKGVVTASNEPQGEPVVLSVDNQPMKLIFIDHGDNSAEYKLKTGYDMSGIYSIIVRASDGVSLDATTPLVITAVPKRR